MQTMINHVIKTGLPFFVQGHSILVRINEQTHRAANLQQLKELLK